MSVHGDDFTSVGAKADLDWLEARLEGKYGLRKCGRLGPGEDDAKEILVLNRAIRWTDNGLEYEADQSEAVRKPPRGPWARRRVQVRSHPQDSD